MKNKYIILFLTSFLFSCTAPQKSERALQKAGFTKIKITGYKPFSCSEDDQFSTGFEANNSNNERVEGVVCCGLYAKNCTIRF